MVEVPDAGTGNELAERLGEQAQVSCTDGGAWVVMFEDGSSARALAGALRVIENWLRDEQLGEIQVRFNGQAHRMACPA